MTTTAGPGAGQPALRRLDCPRCGASVPQFTPDAQVIVCRSCHANLTEGIDGLRWTTGARLPRSRLPVHLGQQIILDGAPMLVLGRVRYQGWELGEPDERWTWDEWLLAAPDGRMPWLVHDEHGVSLFTRARLNAPFDPAHDSQIAVGTGRLFRVTASYTTQVVGVEGELTSRVAAGDRLTTVEGRRADRWCSVQQSESELECYEGRRLTPDEVTRALGSHATAVLRPARPPLAVVGGVLTLFALLGLLLAAAAAANPVQSAEKAAEKAAGAVSGTVTKAEKAVKRGAKKAEGAIEQGVGAANRGADKVGAKVGLPPGSASAAKAAQAPR